MIPLYRLFTLTDHSLRLLEGNGGRHWIGAIPSIPWGRSTALQDETFRWQFRRILKGAQCVYRKHGESFIFDRTDTSPPLVAALFNANFFVPAIAPNLNDARDR